MVPLRAKEIRPENRRALYPGLLASIGHPAVEVATVFVLEDDPSRELDCHVVRFDEYGRGIPAWNSDLVFSPEASEGLGIVGSNRLRCLPAETQMRTHNGYVLKESDVHDLRLLHDRFGIDYPDESADFLEDEASPGVVLEEK